ncbi:MAG: hypothetical protein JWM10_3246, partial [Myxococcaceae bacterium]|nr:hypothetical protein [Myxococcaceae bacterium]
RRARASGASVLRAGAVSARCSAATAPSSEEAFHAIDDEVTTAEALADRGVPGQERVR